MPTISKSPSANGHRCGCPSRRRFVGYTLAGRCRVEIDGAFYDYAENTRTGLSSITGLNRRSFRFDRLPVGFYLWGNAAIGPDGEGYPGRRRKFGWRPHFGPMRPKSETIGESLKVNSKTLHDSIGKGSATMTLYIGEAEDDALGALCLDVGRGQGRVQAQLVDYRKREVRFPALKTGDIYAVRIHGSDPV